MKKPKKGTKRAHKTSDKKRIFRAKKRRKKKHEIKFCGGDITSAGGAILLEKVDKNRVEQALAGRALSHHRTCVVAYGGFGSVFIEQLT